ncbi:SH2 domain protein A [Striga asiatica]|uniref:SH2 domain protein A n=1 Tax=Striga asiatica TaxID=4170 RepID=A0A5A7P6E8_STRAF|nr:SH2 domain protein A [Striga asiatica]
MYSKFLFALFIFFLAAPIFPSSSITLYGGAFLNAASIALSKEKNFTFLPLPLFFSLAPPPLFRAFSLSPSTVQVEEAEECIRWWKSLLRMTENGNGDSVLMKLD